MTVPRIAECCLVAQPGAAGPRSVASRRAGCAGFSTAERPYALAGSTRRSCAADTVGLRVACPRRRRTDCPTYRRSLFAARYTCPRRRGACHQDRSGKHHRRPRGDRRLGGSNRQGLFGSDVVIQVILVRHGPQVDRRELALALVGDPGLDHVGGEDIALEQPGVIRFEGVEHLAQRAGRLVISGLLFGLEVVEVLVDAARPGRSCSGCRRGRP